MKRIDIAQVVKDARGKAILLGACPLCEHRPETDQDNRPATLGDLIEQAIQKSAGKPGSGADAVRLVNIIDKVAAKDFDGELENAEYERVEKLFNDNAFSMSALFQGRALILLKNAPAEDLDKE